MASAVWPPDYLHRIHGARREEHLSRHSSHRQAVSRRRHQLGLRSRKDPNLSALGLLETALCLSIAHGLVPRHLLSQRQALPPCRNGFHPPDDRQKRGIAATRTPVPVLPPR